MIRIDVKLIRRAILSELYDAAKRGEQPNLEELANRLDCHRNTVWLHVHALENSGYIKIERGKGRASSLYEILPMAKEELCTPTPNS